jgi:hypothetical protein
MQVSFAAIILPILSLGILIAQELPQFTATVRSVAVDTSVTVGQRPIEGLLSEDFVVQDTDALRKVQSMRSGGLPLDIVLVSAEGRVSTFDQAFFRDESENYLADRTQNAAANVLRRTGPQDRVAFVTYALDPHIDLPFTNDRERIAAAIRRLGTQEGKKVITTTTTEFLALEYAVHMLADVTPPDPVERAQRRRLIVVLRGVNAAQGPSAPVSSAPAENALIHRLWEHNVMLSSIRVTSPRMSKVAEASLIPPEYRTGPIHSVAGGVGYSLGVEYLAHLTGGDALTFLNPQDPDDLITRLRQRYILWFDQPANLPPGQERKITVELSPEARQRFPDAVVQARQGYVTR